MQPAADPCGRQVHWFDTGHTTACVLPRTHDGLHCDGERWFDDHGLQRPTELAGRGLPPQGSNAGNQRLILANRIKGDRRRRLTPVRRPLQLAS